MDDIQQQVKEIKQSFRLAMDGATAQSMRQKGLDYHLNWGVTLPRLQEMAREIASGHPPLYQLALALWKENVRECKILATMLMPPGEMLPEVADIWMEQVPTVEVAEQVSFNLFQHLPYAAEIAFLWLSSPDDLPQICGYHVLSRLFLRRQEFNERAINEFVDQSLCALQSANPLLQKAAMQALIRFSEMGLVYERIARSAIRTIGLDFL